MLTDVFLPANFPKNVDLLHCRFSDLLDLLRSHFVRRGDIYDLYCVFLIRALVHTATDHTAYSPVERREKTSACVGTWLISEQKLYMSVHFSWNFSFIWQFRFNSILTFICTHKWIKIGIVFWWNWLFLKVKSQSWTCWNETPLTADLTVNEQNVLTSSDPLTCMWEMHWRYVMTQHDCHYQNPLRAETFVHNTLKLMNAASCTLSLM